MEIKDFLTLMSRKKQTIWSLLSLFFILAVLFTAVQPMKYGSSEKMLVVQNFVAGSDPYSFSKANEYLSNILAEVVVSNSFFNKIMDSGFQIDKNYFAGNNKQKMKMWNKTVSARAVNDTGIIEISVYHTDRGQAEQLALAIGYVLKTSHQYYHGGGEDVIVKMIDEPITSNWPVKPNIILNLSLALVFGLIISLSYIYLFPEEKYDFRLWKKKIKYTKIEQKITDKIFIDGGLGTNHRVVNFQNNNLPVETVVQKEVPLDRKIDNYEDVVARGNINNLL